MSLWPKPPISKSAVNRAGQEIAKGTQTQEAIDLLYQWRSVHGYVINTFQIFLKRRISKQKYYIEFAQRLKRRNTVIQKLRRRRPDGTFLMGDVTSMHDYAGCRLIFDNLTDLNDFREFMWSKESLENVKHVIRHEKDKYDYIKRPKSSGYRGIHDVFSHHPRPHRKQGVDSKPWHGLLVEVQYRTRVQHAWATALEISDIIDGESTKFNLNMEKRSHFFALASELLARKHEKKKASFLDKTFIDIRRDFKKLEEELGILKRLYALKKSPIPKRFRVHNVLSIWPNEDGDPIIKIETFSNAQLAINRANELEQGGLEVNVVYVRSDKPKQLISAYRNYFNDPVDFVKLITEAARIRV